MNLGDKVLLQSVVTLKVCPRHPPTPKFKIRFVNK
jgi:hypothetical protein